MNSANTERTGWGSVQYGDDRFLIYSYVPGGMAAAVAEPGVLEVAAPEPATKTDCCFWDQFERCFA